MFIENNATILGTGSYLPEYKLSDEEIVERLSLKNSSKALSRMLNIFERREARGNETCSDMIINAAKKVLHNSGVKAEDLEGIIISAMPGDYIEPATASIVQYKLGAKCWGHDVGMSCVGWLAGIQTALGCLAMGMKNILVMSQSRIGSIKSEKPYQRGIFGDGAGGVLISKGNSRINNLKLWTFGEYNCLIRLSHGGLNKEPCFYMAEEKELNEAFNKTIINLRDFWKEHDPKKVDYVFVHKASNKLHNRVLDYFSGALGISEEKIYQNFNKYGNTVSADLPIVLDEAVRKRIVKRGDNLFLFSYGSGISAGACLLEY